MTEIKEMQILKEITRFFYYTLITHFKWNISNSKNER